MWWGTRHEYTTTVHSANKKQRPGRNQARRHQPDHESHDRLARASWPSSGIVEVFFSSIFYHMVLQWMVHMKHHSFTGYIFLFRRNVAEDLGVTCCFFTTMHLFTNPTLYRLLFSTLTSPNWIIVHILQMLHPAIIICSQIWRIFFVAGILRAIMPVNDYLESVDFLGGIESWGDRQIRVIVSQGEWIQQIWKLLFSDVLTHDLHELSGQPDISESMVHITKLHYCTTSILTIHASTQWCYKEFTATEWTL